MILTPENTSTPAMRNLVVRMRVAKGVKWVVPKGSTWKCDTDRRGTRMTCKRSTLASGQAISKILTLKVSSTKKVSAKKSANARITGTAKWRTGQGSSARSWLDTGGGSLEIQPKLGVDLSVVGDGDLAIVSNADRDARAVQLYGTLSRVVGQQVHVKWRQIRGPKVTFVSATTMTTDERRVSQTVLLPKGFVGQRKLTFEVRASAGGQVVTDRATVWIDAEQLQGKVAPRDRLIAKALDQAPDNIPKLVQVPEPTRAGKVPGKVRLVGPKGGLARPGEQVLLKIKTGLPVKGVTWVTSTEEGQESTTVGGKRLTVTTPDVGEGYVRVAAYIRLAKKRSVVRSFILMPKPIEIGNLPPTGDVDDKKNKALFCALAKNLVEAKASGDNKPVEVTSKDKSVLKLQPSKVVIPTELFPTPGDCSGKGTIDFGGATLESSTEAVFTKVEGTISFKDAIQLKRMTWTLEEEFWAWLPPTVRKFDLAEGNVTVGYDPKKPGEWAAITGTSYLQPYSVAELTVTGIPFVPLPDGWTISSKNGAFLQFYKDEDKGIPDGSLQLVQKATGPGPGSTVQVSVARKATADKKSRWGQVMVAATNLEIFKTPEGQHVMASGDVVFDLVRSDPSSEQLNLQITCASPDKAKVLTGCSMGSEVYFKDGKLRMSLPRGGVPTTGGYLLSATIAFGGESSAYLLKAEGAYKSKDSWSATVKEDVTFDMGPGMSAVGFNGVIKQSKEKVDGEDKVVLTFDVATSVSLPEFANDVDVKKVTGRVTNKCEKDEPNCQATEIRLKVGVDLVIPAPTGKKIDAALTGDFNFKTKGLILRADVSSGTPLGPDEWNFKSGSIFASRAGYGYCQSQDAKDRAPSVWAVGFQGKGTLFGEDTNLTMQFSKDGSCIWGSLGKLATGGVPASGVVVSWTSFPKGAMVKVSDKESFRIKANTGSLKGLVDLPDAVNDFLGAKGKLEFTGEITGKFEGGLLEIAYTGKSASPVVNDGGNSFDLTKIALRMKWSTGKSAELGATAEGLLTIKGNPGKQIADSVTPLGVTLSIMASNTGVRMTISAYAGGSKPTQNAFGVQGLTVRALAASAAWALPSNTVQVSFNADVTTPKAWEGSGLRGGTPVSLAFSVGTGAPWCIDFEFGIQRGTEIALDVGNAGFLTATWFKLLIAPAGCTVPIAGGETRKIPAGYGFAFEGQFAGAPIIVALNVGLGTGVSSNFTMQGDLRMPKLELPLITLSGADGRGDLTVSLDIDTAKRKYDAAIDAGVLVGYPDWGLGARVRVRGQLVTSGEEIVFSVWAAADFNLTGASMKLDPFSIYLKVKKGTMEPIEGRVHARVRFGIFDVELLSGEVGLAYQQGRLVHFGVIVGASLDIKIAKLTGNVGFTYCLGSIGGTRTRDGWLAECYPYRYKASARPSYRIDLGGKLKTWIKDFTYYWEIAAAEGGEGDPAFEPKQRPGPLPGPTADIDPKENATLAFLTRPGNAIQLTLGDKQVLFRSIRPAKVSVPRESRTVEPCTRVQVGTKAYRPAPQTFPKAEILNPVPQGDCGLIAAYVGGEGTVRTVPVVCTQNECRADDKQLRLGGLQEARDQILAMLRQPPGVLPPGAEIYYDSPNWATDKGLLSGLQSILRVVYVKTKDKSVYHPKFDSTVGGAPRTISPLNEFPPTPDRKVRYYLTERGVLASSQDGAPSIGQDAALDEVPPPESQPVLALVGKEIVVYCGPSQDSGILWKYGQYGYTKVKDCKARP